MCSLFPFLFFVLYLIWASPCPFGSIGPPTWSSAYIGTRGRSEARIAPRTDLSRSDVAVSARLRGPMRTLDLVRGPMASLILANKRFIPPVRGPMRTEDRPIEVRCFALDRGKGRYGQPARRFHFRSAGVNGPIFGLSGRFFRTRTETRIKPEAS
jgi:hypothetical protein